MEFLDAISVNDGSSNGRLCRAIAEFIAVTVAAVLLWSAVAKAFSPMQAQRLVAAVIPHLPARGIVAAICLLEAVIASLLIAGWRRQVMFSALAFLVLGLTVAFWYARSSGYMGGCGCFGSSRNSGLAEVSLRNGGLIIACVLGWQLTLRVSLARTSL
jgi:hypothetical protein